MEIRREQSLAMKGYAILLIMIHNFVDHIMVMGNNEMAYCPSATADFVSHILSRPSVWHIFSFTGWIGVALFIFVSGYGLTRKYGTKTIDTTDYIKHHTIKLWVLLAPMYLLYVLVMYWLCGEPHNWQSILAQLSFTVNILSYGDNSFAIEPGVYWFFGAILQFYLLFLLLRKWRVSWLFAALAGAIALHYGFLYLADDDTMWWFRQNSIGWGAPFLLGMIAAKSSWSPSKQQLCLLLPISIVLLSLCLTIKALMPLTEILTILFFGSVALLIHIKPINAVGIISSSIFVVHPFVRMALYKLLGNSALGLGSMVAIYVIIVAVLSLLHHWLYRPRPRRQR